MITLKEYNENSICKHRFFFCFLCTLVCFTLIIILDMSQVGFIMRVCVDKQCFGTGRIAIVQCNVIISPSYEAFVAIQETLLCPGCPQIRAQRTVVPDRAHQAFANLSDVPTQLSHSGAFFFFFCWAVFCCAPIYISNQYFDI